MALSPKAAHLEALGERGKSLDDIAAMMEEARKTMVKFLDTIPNRTLQFEIDRYANVWTAPGGLERWLDDLRTAGMPE